MSDFDAQQVVDAVRAGTAPETWRVFRAQRRYFYVMGIGMSALAVLCIVTSIAAAYPFAAGAGASNPWSLGLCLGPVGVLFALVAAYSFRQIPLADQQLVAVTPSGFVEYRGVRWGIVRAVEYARFSSVSLVLHHSRRSSLSVALDLTYKPTLDIKGTVRVEWTIDERFGRREEIAQAIIEAHARYVTNHTQTY